MKTRCLECGTTLDSFSDIITGVKVVIHLKRHHERLWTLYNTLGPESVTAVIPLEDGNAIELLGENITYEKNGEQHIDFYLS